MKIFLLSRERDLPPEISREREMREKREMWGERDLHTKISREKDISLKRYPRSETEIFPPKISRERNV